ncbi:hypothetical protein MRB53_025917 [Persea americana]|uniref:Uncharacterized protein n=1 Tax=Persea americana TaxID=3435 RepID=A0ACC2LGM8_PERAE|nr:hypothetical protein MRB53_025917 [Persea americana]
MIIVSDHSLAHKALIQKGSIFSDRPPSQGISRITNSNQHTISSAGYGSVWRVLRRNLVCGVFHHSCVKSYSHGREWVLNQLIGKLRQHVESGEAVVIFEHIQYAMFSLLLQMCLGQKLDQSTVKKIEDIQRPMLVGNNISALFPKIEKIIFRKWWNEVLRMRREKEELFTPLIRAREDREYHQDGNGTYAFSYVDSLLSLEHLDGGWKPTEGEIVSLCSEFLTAGTDTTTTSLQWIMANLVKHQDVIIEARRPWPGAASPLLGENTVFQSLKKVPVEGSNHNSCSYTPAEGGKWQTSTIHSTEQRLQPSLPLHLQRRRRAGSRTARRRRQLGDGTAATAIVQRWTGGGGWLSLLTMGDGAAEDGSSSLLRHRRWTAQGDEDRRRQRSGGSGDRSQCLFARWGRCGRQARGPLV